LSHELSAKLRASLRYGTAFKAPSFNQLYWPMYGNPDLQPEKSRSFEAGLNGRLANGLWSINLFDTEVTDLIALDPNWLPANINQAHLRGVEVVTSMRLGQWEARLNVTLQNPEQSGGVNDGKWLNRRAKQSARIDLDRSSGKWQMGGIIRAESQRYDDLANTVDLPGYALFDLRTAYPINSDWQLSARLENLFDKDYETAYGYSQPGRGLFVTLRYQPQK
jgi:vitamin B12 transporter